MPSSIRRLGPLGTLNPRQIYELRQLLATMRKEGVRGWRPLLVTVRVTALSIKLLCRLERAFDVEHRNALLVAGQPDGEDPFPVGEVAEDPKGPPSMGREAQIEPDRSGLEGCLDDTVPNEPFQPVLTPAETPLSVDAKAPAIPFDADAVVISIDIGNPER